MKKNETFNLIDGVFSVDEAREILMNIFSTKIQFHEMKNLSSEERFEKCWVEYFKTPVDYIHSTYAMDIWEKEHSKSYPTRAISLMWNQRSVDTFLGLPFNIASYGLLLEIIAKTVNMVPDELIGNLGDTHLYLNHVEQAKEQIGIEFSLEERRDFAVDVLGLNGVLDCGNDNEVIEFCNHNLVPTRTREPYPLPTLVINDEFWNPDADLLLNLPHILVSDFYVDNYQSHPTIKAPLSN